MQIIKKEGLVQVSSQDLKEQKLGGMIPSVQDLPQDLQKSHPSKLEFEYIYHQIEGYNEVYNLRRWS